MTTSPANNRLDQFIRFAVLNLVRLFYPRVEVRGRENLPEGPAIFVLNHPNGLIDSLMLMIGVEQKVVFWGKSTLFGNPLGKTLMEAFGGLPIYRSQDDGLPGGPRGDAKERNEVIFARCRALLRQGGALALCPEGTTHSDPQLRRLRTGAARFALGAEEEGQWQGHLQIVPVGLWFESKVHFRTSALLVVGEPFDVTSYADVYAADKEQAIKDLTQQIDDALDKVVLQAENAELLSALPVVAAWTAPQGADLTLVQQHEWSEKLLAVYEDIQRTEPERLERFTQDARQYANALQTLGISEPWALELATAKLWQLVWLVIKLVITFPFALAGFILGYVPYRLVGPIATKIAPDDTQTSTFKLIAGLILVPFGWIAEAVAFGRRFGKSKGLLLALLAPPLAYVALLWGEGWHELREIASCKWLRLQRGEVVKSLKAQRESLAKQVMEAVKERDM